MGQANLRLPLGGYDPYAVRMDSEWSAPAMAACAAASRAMGTRYGEQET